ncbi:MAG: phosphate acyltransferase PlsX [Deferribacteres bacterium]|nr:phosphate acyltransferase PlsX [candidate division KSB1 bacterium]MCB9510676.1 phosphate acyltransferase PlsX [Deferribacteres bacterium]
MKIALDAMGGDHAPAAIVAGGLEAARMDHGQYEVVFVGDQAAIEAEIEKHHRFKASGLAYSIVHASEKIDMCDSATTALKKKPNASILICQQLHRDGEVQAVVSAGHTGATMASALITLGRLPGIHRPSLGTFLPTGHGVTFILDVGAMVDCKPKNLQQFAIMGSIFMEKVVGIHQPKVGLLSIGEERSKGNEVTLKSFDLLDNCKLNFIGNIEGRDILKGTADVVVCDGFVGNILLKFAESFSGVFSLHMRRYIGQKIMSNIGAFLLKPTFAGLKKIWNYEEYGGAPLLGANGVVIIGHGRSTPKAVMNAIREAAKMVEKDVNEMIKKEMQSIDGVEVATESA